MLHRLKLTTFSVLFLAVFLLNSAFFHSGELGLFLLALYVGVFGWELGGVIVSQEKAVLRWWMGMWVLLSVIMTILTASYYLWQIHPTKITVLILLTPPVILWLTKRFEVTSLFSHAHDLWHEKRHRLSRSSMLAAAATLFLLGLYFLTLAQHPVTDAVRSVWERLPTGIFPLFALATLLIVGLLWRGKERALSLLLLSILVFAFISVVAIVFPIGYGFDSFIHKATEAHLAEFGTITPKPFYYIGQYALVLFAHHGFSLPIDLADTYLVPVLTALLLPMAWYFAAAHIAQKRTIAMLTLAGLFLLPLAQFIVTTPQALANLWTLLLVLASIPFLLEKEQPGLRTLGFLAFSTALIHPIAGLPVLLYFMLLVTDPSRLGSRFHVLQKVVRALLVLFACIVLPLSFVLNGILSGHSLGINWSALNPLTWLGELNLSVFFENRFDPLLDFVYLYGLNATLILVLLAGYAWLEYRKDLSSRFRSLIIMAIALGVNYLIMSTFLEFTFLIDYERSNYAARLIPLSTFFLAPLLILGLSHIFVNVREQPLIMRASVMLLLVAFISSGFYMAYPRRDAYETNRGFNVSQADIDTVYLIERMANDAPYLVLANQSVSAAAIQEVGFRYYGDLFFYPIPTGGPLYEYFLAMNETPTRELALESLSLVPQHGDILQVYYVVNHYWWEAPRIVETAKTTADDWRSIGGGQTHIFRYDIAP